ncbi:MAG: hypothetical protein WCL00_15050, partial [Bacteroidota bacterium]
MDNSPQEIGLPDISIVDEELLIITAEQLFAEAADNLTRRGDVINQVCQMLFELNDSVKSEIYITDLSKRFKLSKKIFLEKLKTLKESSRSVNEVIGMPSEIPDGADEKMARKFGFFSLHSKYYFITKDGLYKASNFIVKPLFHIYSKTDNKRLVEISNEHGYKRILDIPSKSFVSVEQFQ